MGIIVTDTYTTDYGYKTTDRKYEGITVENNVIYFDNTPVLDNWDYADLPTLFVVRKNCEGQERHGEFMFGLDLMQDGKIWVHGTIVDNIKHALNYIKGIEPNFYICLEEPMQL